jgi:hypothetical protein
MYSLEDAMNEKHTEFAGTYFERGSVIRLSRFAAILGWLILAVYLLNWIYAIWQSISGAIMAGYPLDLGFLVFNLAQPFQGAMVLVILLAISKVLLIFLDIEDNTRRTARPTSTYNK